MQSATHRDLAERERRLAPPRLWALDHTLGVQAGYRFDGLSADHANVRPQTNDGQAVTPPYAP
jgi:hypothetical protein